ncbi:carbohydrate ABC transporter permease [Nocardia sp. NPDC059091]|uniref:carbohydrate ABC transporter permease n=1 Tax=unclassified Nocardia TaxID=2637762 RepID=UPI003673D640
MVDTCIAPAAGSATAANEPRKPRRKRSLVFGVPRAVVLILVCVLFAYPLIWMALGAFKTQSTFFANLWGLPSTWDFQNFIDAWSVGNIGRYLLNSIVVTGSSVLLVLVLSLPLSFALARTLFTGGKVIFGLFIITLFMPLQLLIIPMYELEANLGIINTYWGLILPYAAGALPFSVVFATSFFQGLPAELDEAARLDGCNIGQIFVQIFLPLSRPVIATIVILTFLNTWNEFILALTLTQSDSVRTIPVGLLNFSQQMGQTNYPQLFAALTMATIPIFVVFLLTQKQFISGLVEGAVK